MPNRVLVAHGISLDVLANSGCFLSRREMRHNERHNRRQNGTNGLPLADLAGGDKGAFR